MGKQNVLYSYNGYSSATKENEVLVPTKREAQVQTFPFLTQPKEG